MFREIWVLDFDESGFWFSNRKFGFWGKTRLSRLGNPSSKWIFIKRSTSGSHGFLCFAFFRVIQKGSLLGGVSMRWTLGYKTKKEIGFYNEIWNFITKIHSEDRFFIIESVSAFHFLLQNLYFEILLQIYQSGKFSHWLALEIVKRK